MADLDTLLAQSGLSKAGLARQLGLHPDSISRWKNTPPKYAVAYLELLIRAKSVTEGIR